MKADPWRPDASFPDKEYPPQNRLRPRGVIDKKKSVPVQSYHSTRRKNSGERHNGLYGLDGFCRACTRLTRSGKSLPLRIFFLNLFGQLALSNYCTIYLGNRDLHLVSLKYQLFTESLCSLQIS
jgi:hypothetical protein